MRWNYHVVRMEWMRNAATFQSANMKERGHLVNLVTGRKIGR
jgi:hypothetical protein